MAIDQQSNELSGATVCRRISETLSPDIFSPRMASFHASVDIVFFFSTDQSIQFYAKDKPNHRLCATHLHKAACVRYFESQLSVLSKFRSIR